MIKFRAWQKHHEKIGRIQSITFDENGGINHVTFHNGDNCIPVYSNYWKDHEEWDLSALELMYTIPIKDKNDQDIYIGDVVTYFDYNPESENEFLNTGIVEQIDTGFIFTNRNHVDMEDIDWESVEVIGHVYQNLDFLQ
jgi:uncharacterized phage protein (TIGR01671 family)